VSLDAAFAFRAPHRHTMMSPLFLARHTSTPSRRRFGTAGAPPGWGRRDGVTQAWAHVARRGIPLKRGRLYGEQWASLRLLSWKRRWSLLGALLQLCSLLRTWARRA